MTMPKGYTSQEKEDRLKAEFVTISPTGDQKFSMDVRDMGSVTPVGSDAVEAGSDSNTIVATAHGARVGDRIRFTSGTLDGKEADVWSITDANTFELGQDLGASPSVADTFVLLRPISLTLTSSGGFSATTSFTLDGSSQEVVEDTVTPANNRPLPVKLLNTDGDVAVNSTNLNLEVQLDHDSATPDSIQIGDGTETVAINASNEMQVADDTARTSLATIAGDTTSLDTKLPAQGAAVTAASTPVNIASDQTVPISAASLPLPTGAATEATLATIDADTGVIAGDTTSIDGKLVDGNDIGDVTVNNAAGASAVNIQDGGNSITVDNASMDTVAGAVSGSEMQVDVVASLPAGTNNIGDVDIASALPAGTNNIGDVDIASALPTGTNTIGAVNLNRLDVVDLFDTPFEDATNINGSAGAFYEVVASLASDVEAIQIMDTSGQFIGVYTGPAASEVLKFVYAPGSDQTVQVSIASGTRISLRSMESTGPSAGNVAFNFLG